MTRIFAHRGVRRVWPENTMAAFRAAAALDIDGIELDVQRTSDGVLVICHDENLFRLTGEDVNLKDLSLRALQSLNIAHHFPGAAPDHVPTFETFLDWFETTDLAVNIELKNGIVPYEGMEAQVIHAVRAHGLADRTILSTFNEASVLRLRDLAPDMDVALLTKRLPSKKLRWADTHDLDAVHPQFANLLRPRIVARAAKRGLKIRFWTVNHMRHLLYAVVSRPDTIITDDPELALRIRERYGHPGPCRPIKKGAPAPPPIKAPPADHRNR
ncbi:MAG: glycerophosphodiester phosphodiesterase [Saccharofermentanales bacterium]|jgi:glycerophosphoryl diester phosphodiesterase